MYPGQAVEITDPRWLSTFPQLVTPREDEWLAGVLLRCDEANLWSSGTTVTHLLRTARAGASSTSRTAPEQLTMVLPPLSISLATLAGLLAVPEHALVATTYRAELARLYDIPNPHVQLLDTRFSFYFCPECLAETRLLRRTFVLPHLRVCPIHHVVLKGTCPCGAWQRLFSAGTRPFTCRKCGLDWAQFPRSCADARRIILEERIMGWYDFFFSKGTRMMLARAIQRIRQELEARKVVNVKRLNGRSLPVTFSSPEKTSLGRLVDVLVSLDLCPGDLEGDESPLAWRPINWQEFYCPVPACPYMRPSQRDQRENHS